MAQWTHVYNSHINPNYVAMAQRRIQNDAGMFYEAAE